MSGMNGDEVRSSSLKPDEQRSDCKVQPMVLILLTKYDQLKTASQWDCTEAAVLRDRRPIMRRQRNAQEFKTGCIEGKFTVVTYRDSDTSAQVQVVAMAAMIDTKTMATGSI